MTAVKICGLTREEDVALAGELGARWVGLNFAKGSSRRVDLPRGRALAAQAPAGVIRVGVFVDESAEQIRRAIDEVPLDAVQLHRPLRPEDLDLPRPILAVVAVSGDDVPAPPAEELGRCQAVLFDAPRGGGGKAFDWSVLEGRNFAAPVLLAGGLDADNVGGAIARVRPAGVDVASGVESSPGVKDPARMREFFRAVYEADARLG
jgi:phosphoribosylanthranilate isomerase